MFDQLFHPMPWKRKEMRFYSNFCLGKKSPTWIPGERSLAALSVFGAPFQWFQ